MYCLRLSTTLLVVVTTSTIPSGFNVDGFSIPSVVPGFGNSLQSKMDLAVGTNTERQTTIMFGILDDIMDEDASDDEVQDGADVDEDKVELYHSLIFASDLQSEISRRLDDSTDPTFLEYLSATSKSSQDEEERQGLMELMEQIEQVKAETAKKAVEEEEKAAIAAKAKEEKEEKEAEDSEATTQSVKPMSNADILRKANEIDAAIALSDDEKPSDFISDCREVVNLSRGFNDSGQMRVGGR
mmetsp:Transcript_20249/g.50373  ORF Transcript_20249/g.50373 Transcript_20249/m.50373 type:complete len:242 (-) Transcript_20249:220-945(-)